jgi:phosphomevalonate kinase
MKVFAPGKLVLTGAYAVLAGAPAIAIAASRGAIADGSRGAASPTPEVRAALGDLAAPQVDASAMFSGGRKLGLGASAAILVASVAAHEAASGADLASAVVRERIFARARDAHARAQGGGSGVDVAASVHGGAIRYVVGEPVRAVALPPGLGVHVFACAHSARTSELRASVDRLARADERAHRACMDALCASARGGADAVDRQDGAAFVDALRRTARSLARLGAAAGVPIVPAGFDDLEAIASRDEAAFAVSGAGGGDVAVHVGPRAPSEAFLAQSRALGLEPLDLSVDRAGVRLHAAPEKPRAGSGVIDRGKAPSRNP